MNNKFIVKINIYSDLMEFNSILIQFALKLTSLYGSNTNLLESPMKIINTRSPKRQILNRLYIQDA